MYGGKQISLSYTDIANIIETDKKITIQTRMGETFKFSIRDARLCANHIRSRMSA